MKKSVLVLAVIAASCSVAAANDLKQDTKAAVPTIAATQLTDAEMDKVTAGAGYGNETACNARGTCAYPALNHNQAYLHAHVSVSPGSGVNTR